ncbi:hypothetical protein [Yunchengibacter salinarum]|uniref:hypothetical protein n=1 Tax=Yunchengibacter salinarum TaxID=3133399 RepID=UPI0035B660E4
MKTVFDTEEEASDFDVHPRFYLDHYDPRRHDPVDARNRAATRDILKTRLSIPAEKWQNLEERGLI